MTLVSHYRLRICRVATLLAFAALVGFGLLHPAAALACPGCIEGSSQGLYTGFLWGMGLMMAAPLLLIVGLGGGIIHARRKALRDAVEGFLEEEEARRQSED